MNLQGAFASTVLDRESLPQSSLDIANRVRTNPFPWKGQFSPQLVEKLLMAYAPQGGLVLDPFVGSGTSLVESSRLGIPASGCDINSAAVILSRVYEMVNFNEDQRQAAIGEMRERLNEAMSPFLGPLLSNQTGQSKRRAKLEAVLVGMWRESSTDTARNLLAALVVLCDFHRRVLDVTAIQKAWLRLEQTIMALPYSAKPVLVHQADARDLPIDSTSVDLVLTSPPYINVHNYHQKYRRSVEALGWNVLSNARSEIGSNRQNRGNRFLTVIQYSLDMALALREMARVAKPEARLILVLGRESTVRGVRFFNGEIIAEIAVQAVGLVIERRQERVFRNQFGNAIYEDILHFRSRREGPDQCTAMSKARRIAGRALAAGKSNLPDDTSSGIDDALARLETVVASPMQTHLNRMPGSSIDEMA